jgi:hypothetical protein
VPGVRAALSDGPTQPRCPGRAGGARRPSWAPPVALTEDEAAGLRRYVVHALACLFAHESPRRFEAVYNDVWWALREVEHRERMARDDARWERLRGPIFQHVRPAGEAIRVRASVDAPVVSVAVKAPVVDKLRPRVREAA